MKKVVIPAVNLYLFLSIILVLQACSKQIFLTEVRPSSIRIDKTAVAVDPSVSSLIAPYKMQLDSTMHKVIGYTDIELIKNKPNSSMGNWFADILFDQAVKVKPELDFAIQNYGGLRIPSIPKGDITVGMIYELMPFDNTLYLMKLDGTTTKKLLDRIADYGGWPVSKNITFTAEYGEARNIFVKGKAFDTELTYWVALPDYVANGGDNCSFLVGKEGINTGLFIRDLIIRHLADKYEKSETVKVDLTERIKD